MDPLTIGLITGGASLLGNIFTANTAQQNSQMAAQTSMQNNQAQIQAQQSMLDQTEGYNSQQAQWQRNFEEQMSGSAYQRASADMKAAGLNPSAMFGSGGPASTPSSSAASVGTPTVPQAQFAPPQKGNPFAGIGDVVSKAVGSATQAATIEKMTQEIANLQTQQVKTAAETATEQKRPALVQSQTENTVQDMWKKAQETATLNAKMPQAVFEGTVAKDLLSMPEGLRQLGTRGSFLGQKASDVVAPITSSANAIQRWLGRDRW